MAQYLSYFPIRYMELNEGVGERVNERLRQWWQDWQVRRYGGADVGQ